MGPMGLVKRTQEIRRSRMLMSDDVRQNLSLASPLQREPIEGRAPPAVTAYSKIGCGQFAHSAGVP